MSQQDLMLGTRNVHSIMQQLQAVQPMQQESVQFTFFLM